MYLRGIGLIEWALLKLRGQQKKCVLYEIV